MLTCAVSATNVNPAVSVTVNDVAYGQQSHATTMMSECWVVVSDTEHEVTYPQPLLALPSSEIVGLPPVVAREDTNAPEMNSATTKKEIPRFRGDKPFTRFVLELGKMSSYTFGDLVESVGSKSAKYGLGTGCPHSGDFPRNLTSSSAKVRFNETSLVVVCYHH